MGVNTYPEMNAMIKNLLRDSEDNMLLYAAARIEELEQNQIPVRCKDCRFRRGLSPRIACKYSTVYVGDDNYCSFGALKEEKHD